MAMRFSQWRVLHFSENVCNDKGVVFIDLSDARSSSSELKVAGGDNSMIEQFGALN